VKVGESRLAKSILPDGLDDARLVLVKACSTLRLTDEIRIAESVARETRRQFVIAAAEHCEFASELSTFVKSNGVVIVRTTS
jgi:hypothetical protein